MLVRQELKVDGGKVRLRNVVDDREAEKAAYARRRELALAGNARGISAEGTLQHVAMIPEEVYHFDPLCREYQRLRAAKNPEEARRVLRLFLSLNPQYRCSEAKL